MKKIIFLAFLIIGIASIAYSATDWSEFENVSNNLAVEGYQSQPGYIAFYDGNGNIEGYIYFNEVAGELYWVTPSGLALSTGTRIDEGAEVGMPLSEFPGNGLLP